MKPRRLPASFHVAAIYECQNESEVVPGRGEWQVIVERKATTGLGRIDAALRRPDAPPPGPNVSCAAVRVTMAVGLILVDSAGRVLEPAIPIDECDAPQAQIQQAMDHLRWKIVSRRLLTQMETQPELATGCGPAYKDLFALYATQLRPAKTSPVFTTRPRRLTVCVFRDGHGSSPVGSFVRGGTISGPAETAVLDGISKGRNSTDCVRSHSTFAMLWSKSNSTSAAVELGGCGRVLRTEVTIDRARHLAIQHEEIGQTSPAALRILESVGRR